MELIYPSHEIISKFDGKAILGQIEKIGRICYKSEDKITEDSAKKFIDKVVMNMHHESIIEHSIITVKFIVNRGVSHELVRHRLASFTQESTRYVNYNKKGMQFIIPDWISGEVKPGVYPTKDSIQVYTHDNAELVTLPAYRWMCTMKQVEDDYNHFIEDGWKPQQAREILPNSLKTEIVVSANLREWRHILKLRTSSGAHPEMIRVMKPLLANLKYSVPLLFDDI